MSRTTFECRYEPGLYFADQAVENIAEYRSKKLDAMNLVVSAVRKEAKKWPPVLGGYVHDRCLNLTWWYNLATERWSPKRPWTEKSSPDQSRELCCRPWKEQHEKVLFYLSIVRFGR